MTQQSRAEAAPSANQPPRATAKQQRPPFRTLDEATQLAKKRVPPSLFAILEANRGMDGRDALVKGNVSVFEDVYLRPKACVIHEHPDLSTTVLGRRISLPVMLASPGGTRVFHPDGEKAVAAAAGEAGTVDVVAMITGHSIEEVRAASTGPLWQQLYVTLGREAAEELMERAAVAGCEALVVTVDMPFMPNMQGSVKINKSTIRQYGMEALRRPAWLAGFLRDSAMQRSLPAMEQRSLSAGGTPGRLRTGSLTPSRQLAPTWDDFSWIRDGWKGPLVVKGILSADDARRALDVGADAIVVSNHGGLGLSAFSPSLRMLPSVAAAVDGRCEVYFDSGVRSGADVVKAMCLGARAVLVGRPYVMGLAAAGQRGVRQVIEIFRYGIGLTLSQLGCGSVGALSREYADVPTSWPT